MITIVSNGEIYDPRPRGRTDVLLLDGTVAKVGPVDRAAVDRLGVQVDVIDAHGCVVVPGLIDPHQHLLGGSGEKGFASQTPEIRLGEIATAGITTVVGCLGVDTTMKTMAGLLAKAKGLNEVGLTAYVWSGGYSVPPTSILRSVREDIMFVAEVIGAGEVAIADKRATEPRAYDLARLATDAHVGGMLAKKAGLTHVHVGEGRRRLAVIRELLDDYEVEPGWLYLTHVERSEALMEEAIALAARGVTVDIDTTEQDLARWLRFYVDRGGDMARLTVSSDASIPSPRTLFDQVRSCVRDHGFPLERVLPLVTSNTARVLSLPTKGSLEPGKRGDLVVLREGSLDLVGVIAGGRRLVEDGRLCVCEPFLKESNRRIELYGEKS